MEQKELDKLQEAKQIITGVKDSMIMLENSSVKEIRGSVCFVLETALEKAIALLENVEQNAEAGQK